MITRHNIKSETWDDIPIVMPKGKKISKSYRLNELANDLIQSELRARRKRLGKNAKVSEADILEECIYKSAAQNPDFRERIIEELRKDPRFAAVLDTILPKGKDDTKA